MAGSPSPQMDHGGGREPQGKRRRENRRRGKAGSRRKIGGKKPSEGTKASEQEHRQAFGQTGSPRQGSAWTQQKVGKGGSGECSVQSGMG